MKKQNSIVRKTGTTPLLAALAGLLIGASSASAVIIQTPYTDTNGTDLTIANQTSASDLVNTGQATLSLVTANNLVLAFGTNLAAINNGTSWSPMNDLTNGTADTNEVWDITFDLNLVLAPLGYRITQVDTFTSFGADTSSRRASQKYDLQVSLVGNASFSTIASVDFANALEGGLPVQEARMTITDSLGTIATGVDAVRFVFADPRANLDDSAIWRELDVQGEAVAVPEPSSLSMLAFAFATLFLFVRKQR